MSWYDKLCVIDKFTHLDVRSSTKDSVIDELSVDEDNYNK